MPLQSHSLTWLLGKPPSPALSNVLILSPKQSLSDTHRSLGAQEEKNYFQRHFMNQNNAWHHEVFRGVQASKRAGSKACMMLELWGGYLFNKLGVETWFVVLGNFLIFAPTRRFHPKALRQCHWTWSWRMHAIGLRKQAPAPAHHLLASEPIFWVDLSYKKEATGLFQPSRTWCFIVGFYHHLNLSISN